MVVKPTRQAQAAAGRRGQDLQRGIHGTIFREGQTTVDPAGAATPTNYGDSDTGRAYYSADQPEDTSSSKDWSGWNWAQQAVEASAKRGETLGRPVVHQVEAEGNVDIDPNVGEMHYDEYTADRLKITDTNWIRPPSGDVGTQGTLPHINWNQFVATPTKTDLNNVELG